MKLRRRVTHKCGASFFLSIFCRCASSPVLLTRTMAARALRALVTTDQTTDVICRIFQDLNNSSTLSHNRLHGSYLQVWCKITQSTGFKQIHFQIMVFNFLSFHLGSHSAWKCSRIWRKSTELLCGEIQFKSAHIENVWFKIISCNWSILNYQ